MTVRRGAVQRAMRALVAEMGQLSARQRVTAEAAFTLAAALDDEADGSKASALSRELRIVVATLTPAAVPLPKPQAAPHDDPVQRVQDEVARKRRERGSA